MPPRRIPYEFLLEMLVDAMQFNIDKIGRQTNLDWPHPPPEVDIHLDDKERKISGKHLKISNREGEVICEVLGRNGISVNGKHFPAGERVLVRPGDLITLSGAKNYTLKIAGGKS